MSGLDTGKLDRRITVQTSSTTKVNGRPIKSWSTLATVWAEVRDIRPSRAEQIADGLNMANRPCRIVIRYRDDITAGMRVILDGRTLQIVSAPAELGRREGTEFMAEELTTQGQEP